MNKSLRIIAISLISTFFIFCTSCFAVNIDMNLSSNMVDSTSNTTYNGEAASSTQSNESNVTQNLVSGQTSTVSKNTNIVICKDKSKITSKLNKAIELGIKVIEKDEFIKEYLV